MKIISGGNCYNTHIYDDDDKELKDVICVKWEMDCNASGGEGIATLIVRHVKFETEVSDITTKHEDKIFKFGGFTR